MKSRTGRKYLSRRTLKMGLAEIAAGAVLLLIVFMISTQADLSRTEMELKSNVEYIKEQCDNYNRLNLASETKSLMRMIESARQTARDMDYEEELTGVSLPDEKRLQKYAEDSYLTGVFISDASGEILSHSSSNDYLNESLKEDVMSDALLDVASFKEKTYAARVKCKDGSYIDLAACGRKDKDEIIAVYHHTSEEYVNNFNLTFDMLLDGYSTDKDGTIVITNGDQIVASNDSLLTGRGVDEVPVLKRIKESGGSGELHHAKDAEVSKSRDFGLIERGRNYYVYAYRTEREVFQETPRIMMYVLFLYILGLIVLHMVRWKTEEGYRKERLEMQAEYAVNLQSKNEELEEAVRRETKANSAKTNFLSRMTHDIRTPLNGIIGLLKIDEAHPDDQELHHTNREKMLISANHLLSLINDMLQMSKLENNEVTLGHEGMNLNTLSNDILTIVEQRAADAGVTLEYDRSADKVVYPYVYGSPLHIRQIFLNIYGNCIKYNKVGGKVSTQLQCLGCGDGRVTYRWTIADTGIGMSKEFLEHIFEPFAQEHMDARSVYNGTGLGMAIVKNLIDKMDGTIEVSSVEGEGSTFVITIPFDMAAENEVLAKEQQKEWSIAGKRLLIAEDNALNAEIAQVLLKDEGAEVVIVNNGQEAIDTFAENPAGTFDAILMDIMMPLVDGYTASRRIRDLDRADAGKIPIIAMTANAFEEDADRCYEAGMDAHLSKPLQMEKVVETIARCLEEMW